jgi:putative multiple sugar transport system substrate-binding protein
MSLCDLRSRAFAALLSLAAIATLSLAACAPRARIGVVLPTKEEPRWTQDETQFLRALGGPGNVELLFSGGDPDIERANVETLVRKGIKVLIICPHDGAKAARAAEIAKARGVTVICYDRLITDTLAVDYFVTFDSVAVGKAQADYLVSRAGKATRGAPLYLYSGPASDGNAFLFFQGAWEVLQPRVEDGTFVVANSSNAVALRGKKYLTRAEMALIIDETSTGWDFPRARALAEKNLSDAGRGLKGNAYVLAPNDGTAREISDAFSRDPLVTGFVITGQDAERASVQYIIDGKQSMTVFKDTRTLVGDAISMATDILASRVPSTAGSYDNGRKPVATRQSEVVTVDRSNVKSALVDSGYYSSSDFSGL